MQVILDMPGGRRVFSEPRAVVRAATAGELPAALAALDRARADGHWLAGALAYEMGYALEPRLLGRMPAGDWPLLQFGVFDPPASVAPHAPGRAYAGPLAPDWDAAVYGNRFARVKAAIAAGDIYQANLSFRAGFSFCGDPLALYEQLRAAAQAPWCGYVDFADPDKCRILSLSPELFFAIDGGMISSRPMKGTRARSGQDDDAERARLAASPKDRAENLMIVDLIRNDLGRVAKTGSVTVKDLFRVETYPSLHTMVSTVTAQLKMDATIATMLRALFPCGSITGAPKIRAMEILQELESSPRGPYCGALGYFAPDGTAQFNVAIRTLALRGDRGTLGVGGGVVQDSVEDAEYAECLLKARFFEDNRRPLMLIETLAYRNGFTRLARHLARMARSAQALGLAFDPDAAGRALADAVKDASGPLRVRLTLDEYGAFAATAASLPPNPPHWTYSVSPQRLDPDDPLLGHKTDWRDLYDAEAARHSGDEVIFLNTRGELAEGTRSNIFLRRGGILLTPPLLSGVLPGCLRAELLEGGACEEAILTEKDLGGEILLGNSLRGLIPAQRL